MLGLVLNILQLRRTLLEINEWITWYKIPDLKLKTPVNYTVTEKCPSFLKYWNGYWKIWTKHVAKHVYILYTHILYIIKYILYTRSRTRHTEFTFRLQIPTFQGPTACRLPAAEPKPIPLTNDFPLTPSGYLV